MTTSLTGNLLRRRASERVIAIVVLLITLLVGVLIGVAVDRLILPSHGRDNHRSLGALWPLQWHTSLADRQRVHTRMVRDLGLTDDQAVRIDTIMAHRSAAFRAVRSETETRVTAMLDTTRAMIDSVLTPSQRETLHKIRARRQQEREANDAADRPPPPDGPPPGPPPDSATGPAAEPPDDAPQGPATTAGHPSR